MKPIHPTYLSLVLATHRELGDCTAPLIVTGFGILKIYKLGRDGWSFALNASVADSLDDETALLTRLADALSMPTFLVGEQIEGAIFAPLLQAADRLPLPAGAYLGLRVARLRLALPVDVTLGSARRTAPLPYAEPTPDAPPVTINVDAGQIVDPNNARACLEAHAIDNWLRFLRCTGTPRLSTANIATLTWAASRGLKL
jgi:hypothetical protein